MRNITALTFLVIMVNAFAGINYAYSQEAEDKKNYGFSLSPQTGFLYGQVLEVVYSLPGSKSELLSELLWDIKPVFYLGLQLDFGRNDIMKAAGFFSSLSLKAGIPAVSGIMEDRDWEESSQSGNLVSSSSHTNKTRQFFSVNAAFGATLPVQSFFYFKPFISGGWTRFAFTGSGYSGYSEFSDDVITYKQDWLLISPGISAGTKILNPFTLEFSFQISLFTYCTAKDEHLQHMYRSYATTYLDYTYMGLYLEPSVCLSYSRGRTKLSLEYAYRHIGKTSGVTYSGESGKNLSLSQNNSGAGFSLSDLRFFVSILF